MMGRSLQVLLLHRAAKRLLAGQSFASLLPFCAPGLVATTAFAAGGSAISSVAAGAHAACRAWTLPASAARCMHQESSRGGGNSVQGTQEAVAGVSSDGRGIGADGAHLLRRRGFTCSALVCACVGDIYMSMSHLVRTILQERFSNQQPGSTRDGGDTDPRVTSTRLTEELARAASHGPEAVLGVRQMHCSINHGPSAGFTPMIWHVWCNAPSHRHACDWLVSAGRRLWSGTATSSTKEPLWQRSRRWRGRARTMVRNSAPGPRPALGIS